MSCLPPCPPSPFSPRRAALGELSDRGLYEIFQIEFGAANSPASEAARRDFIISEAGYAIAIFLLQVGGGEAEERVARGRWDSQLPSVGRGWGRLGFSGSPTLL